MYYDIQVKHERLTRSDARRLVAALLTMLAPSILLLGVSQFVDHSPQIPGSIEGFLNGDPASPTLVLTLGQDSAEAVAYLRERGLERTDPVNGLREYHTYQKPDRVKVSFIPKNGRITVVALHLRYRSREEGQEAYKTWTRRLNANYQRHNAGYIRPCADGSVLVVVAKINHEEQPSIGFVIGRYTEDGSE